MSAQQPRSRLDAEQRHLLRRVATHVGVLAGLWAVLTSADPASWLVGAPVVLAVGTASALRTGLPALRPLGILGFTLFFAGESVSAGFDVARRIVMPRMPIDPAIVAHEFRLSTPAARIFLAGVVTLLPGTLSAALEGDTLHVHVLDRRMPVAETLARLERRVAAVFAEELTDA